ncbi:hypothetical protein BC830DRAFT_1169109 [Chytriomyces sp. MP71]|nr:hypothetical protein BC830DRAFT_1169109 [Chytriomyces sp. MP71]
MHSAESAALVRRTRRRQSEPSADEAGNAATDADVGPERGSAAAGTRVTSERRAEQNRRAQKTDKLRKQELEHRFAQASNVSAALVTNAKATTAASKEHGSRRAVLLSRIAQLEDEHRSLLVHLTECPRKLLQTTATGPVPAKREEILERVQAMYGAHAAMQEACINSEDKANMLAIIDASKKANAEFVAGLLSIMKQAAALPIALPIASPLETRVSVTPAIDGLLSMKESPPALPAKGTTTEPVKLLSRSTRSTTNATSLHMQSSEPALSTCSDIDGFRAGLLQIPSLKSHTSDVDEMVESLKMLQLHVKYGNEAQDVTTESVKQSALMHRVLDYIDEGDRIPFQMVLLEARRVSMRR